MNNPYKILNVNHGASKREILNAVAIAMRKREYSASDIMKAQKELMQIAPEIAGEFMRETEFCESIKKQIQDIIDSLKINRKNISVPETPVTDL